MSYAVDFTDVADMEIQNILLWMMGRSPKRAGKWQEGLEEAAMSLADFPRRCPLAPEQDAFNAEVRQLLYGKYRILFTIIDTDADGEEDTVRILHVRHGSQRSLFGRNTDENENT